MKEISKKRKNFDKPISLLLLVIFIFLTFGSQFLHPYFHQHEASQNNPSKSKNTEVTNAIIDCDENECLCGHEDCPICIFLQSLKAYSCCPQIISEGFGDVDDLPPIIEATFPLSYIQLSIQSRAPPFYS